MSIFLGFCLADPDRGFNNWMGISANYVVFDGERKNLHLKYTKVDKGQGVVTYTTPKTWLYAQSEWPDPVSNPTKAPKGWAVANHLVDCVTTDELLGRNLFTGQGLQGTNWKNVKTLSQLVAGNDPYGTAWSGNGGAPGLYVFGVNQSVLGETSPIAGSVTPFVDALGSSSVPSNLVGVIPASEASPTNKKSVVSLLVWKNQAVNAMPKVSMMTGGDAEFSLENKAANFMAGEKIQVYKGGHHGSAAGTSAPFIKAVKPDHCIYSSAIGHGHPGR